MASALAHELKQPLGAIANYAEGCLIELKSPEPALEEVRAALERLLAATMRSGRIIEQVRRFVTRHEPTRESFEPNRVVDRGRGDPRRRGRSARRRGLARPGTGVALALGRPGPDPAGAGEPGPERLRGARPVASR